MCLKNILLTIASSLIISSSFATDWTQTSGPASNFSSARAVDLNNDGIKDIVLGGGVESDFDASDNIVQYSSNEMVVALDGATGDYLWKVAGMDQIFGSPIFKDVTGDTIPEVFIGGRNGYFLCINGFDGSIFWEYYPNSGTQDASLDGLYNFYSAQWLPDYNFDGIEEILVTNGGDRKLESWQTNRPAGKLMVINPNNGQLIVEAEMPDGKETYMSPLVHDFHRDFNPDIIFGTGGETQGGNLYRVSFKELMDGDISNATVIASSADKGFIAVPTLADLTGDNNPEIIVSSYDGQISAINGFDNSVLWSYNLPNNETNASPIVGLFNNDSIPDVFAAYLEGVAPTYTGSTQVLIDGSNGQLINQYDIGFLQYTTPLAYDYDSDGIDEIIYATNLINAGNFYSDLRLIDFNDVSDTSLLSTPFPGNNIANTPYIGNLDNDGFLDLFYSHNLDSTSFTSDDGVAYQKMTLAIPDSNHIAFGGYLGTNGDGFYDNPKGSCFQTIWLPLTIANSPTCINGDDGAVDMVSNGCPCMFNDCQFFWSSGDSTHSSNNLTAGVYYGTIIHEDGCVMTVREIVEERAASEYTLIPQSCVGESDAVVGLFNADPLRTVVNAVWQNGYMGVVNYNLAAGIYEVEVETEIFITDSTSTFCSETLEINIDVLEPLTVDFTIEDPNECGENISVAFNTNGVNGPFQYSIDGGLSFSTDSLIENIAAGTYNLSVSDVNSCSAENTFTINSYDALVYQDTLTNENSCDGNPGVYNLMITNGLAPFTNDLGLISYDGNFVYDELDLGINLVSITDASGCTLEFEIEADEAEALNVEADVSNETVQFTADGNITLTIEGGALPYSIDWGDLANNANGFSAENVTAGTYTIIVSDANNCTFEIEETVVYQLASSLQNFTNQNQYVNRVGDGLFKIVSNNTIEKITIYNINGKLIDLKSNETNLINISDEAKGIYFATILLDGNLFVQKLIFD